MFTGIVQAVGHVTRVRGQGDGARLTVACPAVIANGLKAGDSVAVAGACLTAMEPGPESFCADLSAETLRQTTLGRRRAGDAVNLEPALRAGDPLGGHLVSGHVDGVGTVDVLDTAGEAWTLRLTAPEELMRYIARKGSVTVDGVSLTVNDVDKSAFAVAVIPHTRAVTTLGALHAGAAVNLEVDLLARYLDRLLGDKKPSCN